MLAIYKGTIHWISHFLECFEIALYKYIWDFLVYWVYLLTLIHFSCLCTSYSASEHFNSFTSDRVKYLPKVISSYYFLFSIFLGIFQAAIIPSEFQNYVIPPREKKKCKNFDWNNTEFMHTLLYVGIFVILSSYLKAMYMFYLIMFFYVKNSF